MKCNVLVYPESQGNHDSRPQFHYGTKQTKPGENMVKKNYNRKKIFAHRTKKVVYTKESLYLCPGLTLWKENFCSISVGPGLTKHRAGTTSPHYYLGSHYQTSCLAVIWNLTPCLSCHLPDGATNHKVDSESEGKVLNLKLQDKKI